MNLGKLAISLPAPFATAKRCVELAQRAEQEWGYDAVWLAETNGPDSFALAGAIASTTERIAIGTAIVPVYNRTPAILAMGAGTVAQLSDNRFILGLGSSSHGIIRDWHGISFELPLTRVRDSVAVLRQALAGQKTDFKGNTLQSQNFRLGTVPDKPVPIYLAGLREKMLQTAGKIGDGLIVNLFPLTATPQILSAYHAGAAKVGRDSSGDEIVCRFQVAVTDDVPAARDLVRMAFGSYIAAPVYNKFFAWCGFEQEAEQVATAFTNRDRKATAEAMTDDLVDRVTVLGSAEQCREQIAAFVEAGVTTPVISPLTADPRSIDATFEAFAPARHP